MRGQRRTSRWPPRAVFAGPVVLLGISLSLKDEPVFLRALHRLGVVLGSLPFAAMRQMMGSVTEERPCLRARRAERLDDLPQ